MSEENSSQDTTQSPAPQPAVPTTPPQAVQQPTVTPANPQEAKVATPEASQALVDSLIKQTMVPPVPPPPGVPPNQEAMTVPMPDAPGSPPGQPDQTVKKKRGPASKVMVLVTMLVLLVSIPVAVYYYFQQRQAVYEEGRAAYPTPVPWGNCTTEGQITSMACANGVPYSKWICVKKDNYLTLKPCVPAYAPNNPACTDANKCTNVCPWPLTNGQCCPKAPDNCSNPGSYICIPDPFIAQCTAWNSSCPAGQQNYWKAIAWYGTVEELMNDPRCDGGGGTPTPGTQRTPTPGSQSTPTPTSPTRPDYCVSTVVDRSKLLPGQTVRLTSTSTTNVDGYFFAAYNMDNLYGPGNPKPVCVATGGDSSGSTSGCPAGTHHLIFKDPVTTLRKSGSRMVPFDNIFVPDANNANKVPSKVQFNGYFALGSGQWSLPKPACVAWIESDTPQRPEACLNSVIDKSIMSPGGSVTITSTSKTDMNNFTYAAYNMDNLYGPGNPKPICVSAGGDAKGVQGDCPTGTYHLIFADPQTVLRRTGKRTLTFEQIFVQDKNNGSKVPTKVQFNSYFSQTGGPTSLPNAACVNWTAIGCKNIRIYNSAGADITDKLISDPSGVVKNGDTIQIGIGAGAATKGRGRVNGGGWTESATKNSQGMYVVSFKIPEDITKFDIEAEVYLEGRWQ